MLLQPGVLGKVFLGVEHHAPLWRSRERERGSDVLGHHLKEKRGNIKNQRKQNDGDRTRVEDVDAISREAITSLISCVTWQSCAVSDINWRPGVPGPQISFSGVIGL